MSDHQPTAGTGRVPSNALLLTVHATLRKVEVTPLGHLSCVLETADGQTYSAIGDPYVADFVELHPGAALRAVVLRMRRAGPETTWHWHLLCCRAAPLVAEPQACLEHLPA